MSLLEDLNRVYKFHIENDWVQGQNRVLTRVDDADGGTPIYGYCLVGSILYGLNWTAMLSEDEWIRLLDLENALLGQIPKDLGIRGELLAYNDTVATKKEDVTDLIKRTITAEMARMGAELMGDAK